MFVSLIESDNIKCIIDINKNKQGKYVAKTAHRVVSPDEISDIGIKNIIVMNPNYLGEIKSLIDDSTIQIIEI